MEQEEIRHREMKINLSINQQEQQKEDVRTKRKDSASAGGKEQELIGRDSCKQLRRISIPIFDGNKSKYVSQHSQHVLSKHLQQLNTSCYS